MKKLLPLLAVLAADRLCRTWNSATGARRSRRHGDAEPVVREEAPAVLGVLPQRDADRGHPDRTRLPGNFNDWVGWKWRIAATQPLANEPPMVGRLCHRRDHQRNFAAATRSTTRLHRLRSIARASRGMTARRLQQPTSSSRSETLIKYEGFNAHPLFVDNVASVSAPTTTRSCSS